MLPLLQFCIPSGTTFYHMPFHSSSIPIEPPEHSAFEHHSGPCGDCAITVVWSRYVITFVPCHCPSMMIWWLLIVLPFLFIVYLTDCILMMWCVPCIWWSILLLTLLLCLVALLPIVVDLCIIGDRLHCCCSPMAARGFDVLLIPQLPMPRKLPLFAGDAWALPMTVALWQLFHWITFTWWNIGVERWTCQLFLLLFFLQFVVFPLLLRYHDSVDYYLLYDCDTFKDYLDAGDVVLYWPYPLLLRCCLFTPEWLLVLPAAATR